MWRSINHADMEPVDAWGNDLRTVAVAITSSHNSREIQHIVHIMLLLHGAATPALWYSGITIRHPLLLLSLALRHSRLLWQWYAKQRKMEILIMWHCDLRRMHFCPIRVRKDRGERLPNCSLLFFLQSRLACGHVYAKQWGITFRMKCLSILFRHDFVYLLWSASSPDLRSIDSVLSILENLSASMPHWWLHQMKFCYAWI